MIARNYIFTTKLRLLVLAFSFCGIVATDPCVDRARAEIGQGENVSVLGRWANGSCWAVASDATRVCMGNGALLEIYDTTSPTLPVLLGEYTFPAVVRKVELEGNIAFVLSGQYSANNENLSLIDISVPSTPVLLGSLSAQYRYTDFDVFGDHIYVIHGGAQIQIVNASDPNNPFVEGTYSGVGLGWPRGIDVVGDYAYVANYFAGLTIIDVGDPANPTFLGNADITVTDVAVIGQYAFLSAIQSLHVFDVSDPTAPFEVLWIQTGFGSEVIARDDWIYVAGGALSIVDISVPAAPVLSSIVSPASTTIPLSDN